MLGLVVLAPVVRHVDIWTSDHVTASVVAGVLSGVAVWLVRRC